MDSRFAGWRKPLAHAVLMGMAGVMCLVMLDEIDERYGLNWLFALRGVATAPADVVVIAIDQASASRLGYPVHVSKWPRAAHADLIGRLAAAGAGVIMVDLVFSVCRNDADDQKLADAIKKANNVVLVEGFFPGNLLGGESQVDSDFSDHAIVSRYVRQKICPVFVDASTAQSPFILPSTTDGRVTHYWHFATLADNAVSPLVETQPIPMLPALAMQVFAMPLHAEFVRVVQRVHPSLANELSVAPRDVEEMMLLLRKAFISQPHLQRQLRQGLAEDTALDLRQKQIIRGLIDLYASDGKRYLNFYGPPRSVRTISYHQILEGDQNQALLDLQGKAVFIGVSAQSQSEQDFVKAGDDYVSPFSGTDGAKISGVEIAATVFANLLDDRTLVPLSPWVSSGFMFILGFVISLIFFRISSVMMLTIGVFLLSCYWIFTYYHFAQFHIWLPLIAPTVWIFSSMLITVLMKSHGKIRQFLAVFRETLPEKFESDVRNSHAPIEVIHETTNGICMFTDIWRYSAIAEKMDPHDLRRLMARYFAVLKEQIILHDGEVISTQGDEVHAVWRIRPANIHQQKTRACLACLDIARAIERFHRADNTSPLLQTRIGLHCGEMSLRLIQASRSHAISATGDTVNTAKRIENANKILGTQLLMSASVTHGLKNFLLRSLGEFILPGMSRKVLLMELVAHKPHAEDKQRWLCETFELGLMAYQARQSDIAMQYFLDILHVYPDDGPARFYLARCNEASLTQASVIHLHDVPVTKITGTLTENT
jgi:adenylate cyclase